MHAPPRALNLRRFISSSSVYAIGDLLTKSARFILIPYYVHVLTRAELGTLAVLQSIAIFSWTLFAFGFGLAVPRFYFEYKDKSEGFVVAMWWTRAVITALPCALLIAIAYGVAPIWMASIPVNLIAMSIISGYLRAGFNIIEAWYMIREQPVRYRSFTFLQFITTTCLVIYLVSGRGMGVSGVVIGEVASFMFWTIVSTILLAPAGKPNFRAVAWRDVLTYCVSLLPYTLSLWAIGFSDRVVLQHYVNLKDLGVYEFGYTLASVITVAATAMRAAWLPSFFRNAAQPEGRRDYSRTSTYFLTIIAFVATSFVLFAPEIIAILGRSGYEDSVQIMRVVIVGLLANALFIAFSQPLLFERKNFVLSVTSMFATGINVALNLWWVPQHGILGSAFAILTTYSFLAISAFIWTYRNYRMQWSWTGALGAGVASLVTGFVGCTVTFDSMFFDIPWKVLLLLSLFGVLVFFQRWQGRAADDAHRLSQRENSEPAQSPPDACCSCAEATTS